MLLLAGSLTVCCQRVRSLQDCRDDVIAPEWGCLSTQTLPHVTPEPASRVGGVVFTIWYLLNMILG